MCVYVYVHIHLHTQIIKECWKGQFKPSNKWNLNIRLLPNFDNISVCSPSEWKYLVFALSSKKDYWDAELGILSNLFFFFFFLLKEEVKYEALNMPQDQYRVATWLETAMEQNNPVLILCVCVCVFCSPVASSTAFWQINMVNELCSCTSTLPHLFLDIAASRKKQGERWMLRVLVLCGLGLNQIKVARVWHSLLTLVRSTRRMQNSGVSARPHWSHLPGIPYSN